MDLADLQTEVENRMGRGERFNSVEDWINSLDIPGAAKSGLWLLAFALIPDRRAQRQLVVQYLGVLAPAECVET